GKCVPPSPLPGRSWTMRIFVYEFLCGGAVNRPASCLRREGWAMLDAVLEDLCRCPGVRVVSRLDPALKDAKNWPRNLTIHSGRPNLAFRSWSSRATERARKPHFWWEMRRSCKSVRSERRRKGGRES